MGYLATLSLILSWFQNFFPRQSIHVQCAFSSSLKINYMLVMNCILHIFSLNFTRFTNSLIQAGTLSHFLNFKKAEKISLSEFFSHFRKSLPWEWNFQIWFFNSWKNLALLCFWTANFEQIKNFRHVPTRWYWFEYIYLYFLLKFKNYNEIWSNMRSHE